ncbi:hypothetical protein XELAEV_18027298mg [Xenopus laevis]|uniref:Uncharacterized protein n=1 Tax=Xenopus laevis TaxID=8355 RepID=A0A974CXV5_XENLA|nr:hypothetical protein XELAEV_18027298mg [Xenopus laevis]
MGKPQKLKSEKEKAQEKRQPLSEAELGPLFLRKKTECGSYKMGIEQDEVANISTYIANLPTKSDIKDMLKEVTSTLKEELREIRRDIASVAGRTVDLEMNQSKLFANQRQIHIALLALNTQINEIQRQQEDLDLNTLIEVERAHRVFKPKTAPQDTPRDTICCLNSYALKEEIILKTREASYLTFEESPIKLFQDISKGQQATIRFPKDTKNFMMRMQIPHLDVPAWLTTDPCPTDTDMDFTQQEEWKRVVTPSKITSTPRS